MFTLPASLPAFPLALRFFLVVRAAGSADPPVGLSELAAAAPCGAGGGGGGRWRFGSSVFFFSGSFGCSTSCSTPLEPFAAAPIQRRQYHMSVRLYSKTSAFLRHVPQNQVKQTS